MPGEPDHGCCETYDVLVGPGDFHTFLGEPEDCKWWRDGKDAVARLNEQHDLLERGLAIVAHAIMHGMPITEGVAAWRNETCEILRAK
jgi:hypothetical protein